ncbi:MAG: chitobiase/beta-hexosaminidase C-terminal domain-containing protein [Bacteroidota bacterium]
MQKTKSILLNFIFFLQVLLLFLLVFESHVELPVWLQVAGRLHPVLLHLPIGLLAFFAILLIIQNEFKKRAYRKITVIVLLLTSVTASITALFGFFLSRQGDYGPDALTQHKISGAVLSVLCYVLVLAFGRYEKKRVEFFALAIAAIGLVLFVGHTGGTLTHGENYVFAPLVSSSEDIPADASLYRKAVYPILEKKCISCHNEAKAKGKLVMTSIPKFQKGGKEGVEWIVGKPNESRMIKYIHLPLDDDDHMPPDGKTQLSKQEISLLEYWIKAGADFNEKLTDLPDDDTLKVMAIAIFNTISQPVEEKHYAFSGASEKTIESLNTPFRSVFPLYQNSAALQADFFVKKSFQNTALEELKEVQDQLVVLNLSKMPVTDNDLATVGNFKNLEKLNLNFTEIKGTGLSSIASLKNLTSLSLAGTDVKMEDVKSVMELPLLSELFIWNTKITEEEKQKLAKDYPKVVIATSQFIDDKVLRLTKPVLVNEGIVKKGDKVILKHTMPGVTIRYTLDGSKPDSISSTTYETAMSFNSTIRINAMACKEGWYCSEVFEVICFVEGHKPESSYLLTPPDKQYPGEGAKTLTDGRKGYVDSFRESSWLGYRDNVFIAEFSFGSAPPSINKIVISNGENIGGYIFPPTEMEVWAGQNSKQLKRIKTWKSELLKDYRSQRIEALEIILDSKLNYTVYKIIAKPISKLPGWHSGKGKNGWFFVDEVFFY